MQTPTPGAARPLLPHEFEAMFAEIGRRSVYVMSRLEYLSRALEMLADRRSGGVVAGELPEDASAVVHLRAAVTAAKAK
jgi:hypothetical protein